MEIAPTTSSDATEEPDTSQGPPSQHLETPVYTQSNVPVKCAQFLPIVNLMREHLPQADEDMILREVAKLQKFTDKIHSRMQEFCSKVTTRIVDGFLEDTAEGQRKDEAVKVRIAQEQEISDSLSSIAAYFKSYQTRLKKFRAYQNQLHEFQFRLDVADRCNNCIRSIELNDTLALMQRYSDVMSKLHMDGEDAKEFQ